MMWTLALAVPFAGRPHPELSWLLAGAAVIIIGIAKSGFGGGVGILATPLLIFAVGDVTEAVGAQLPILIAADLMSNGPHWGTWDKKNLRELLPGTMLGVAIGAGLLLWLGKLDHQQAALKEAVGTICLIYPVLEVIKRRWAPQWRLRGNWAWGTGVGATAGTVSTLAHAAGPVYSIYGLAQHMPRQAFVGTAVIYFTILNLVKLIPYLAMGLIDTGTLWIGLWLVPLVPVGTYLGAWLSRRMSEELFRGVIMGLVILTGIDLIWG
ncbi:MAG: sulfite exporter TauE/SafE family protein [Phycisphaeraceae bacterium]|nr:sulfite exporter TauE/SafE family protein [Phycisphaeraceae bacterium]